MSLENVSLSKEAITGASSKIFANALSDNLFKDNSGELDGGIIGNIFSSGVGSATNTIANNVMKGLVLTSGLGRNVGTSLASSGVGIGSNFIGQGIDSLGGHSMLSRGVGQGVATGLGTVGGLAVSNLIKYGTFAGKATNGSKAALIGKGAGSINPYGLAATVAGTALGAAFGPSKEYKGKYGSITQTMDTVYDGVTAAANFIPGWGQLASGFMTLNKGLSNIFGSTSGMTKTDAILGSAFMPAPVKWLNMANAKTTGGVDNYSWLNQEKLGGFMGDAFGDTWSKINKAVDESGKTYGTFSNSAYKDAQGNINYVNSIYNPLLTMANQNEYQGIRAFDMDTINNLRYSQWIQGGFKPITVGKRGMKIFNNATNHNMGMRLLSAAALIDNKQMILSALGGTKVPKLLTAWLTIEKSDNIRVLRPIVVEPTNKHDLISLEYSLPEVVVTPTNDASWLFSDGRFKRNYRRPLGDKYTRRIVSNYLSKFDNENAKDYNARISRLSDVLDIRGIQFVENKVKSGKLKGRAHYIDLSGTAYINNMDDIFAEVAHPWQYAKGNNNIIEEIYEGKYDSDSDPRGGTRYAYPDTAEGETHSFFEPTLLEWIKTGKIGKSSPLINKKLSKQKIQPKDRVEVVDSAASWNRQAILKRILANPNQLPLWERIKYSFVNYPLLNKSK